MTSHNQHYKLELKRLFKMVLNVEFLFIVLKLQFVGNTHVFFFVMYVCMYVCMYIVCSIVLQLIILCMDKR